MYRTIISSPASFSAQADSNLLNHKQRSIMYMDDIKLFAKVEKELETLTQALRIYNQYIGMEFGIEKFAMIIMRNGKQQMTEGISQVSKVGDCSRG